jgi:hypothetical protein
MSYYNDYDYEAQRRAEQQRRYDQQQQALAIGRKIGRLETSMSVFESALENYQRQAQQAAWEEQERAHKARVAAATPTPAPPPVDPYEEIKRAARAPRPVHVSKVIDPLCASPGSNIRMG